jgi:hypothetical protein
LNNVTASLKRAPVIGTLVTFAESRPRLAAWFVLSLGIVILLLVEARDVGLLFGQWIALIVASVAVAGACIWIVSWEDADDEKPVDTAATKSDAAANATILANAAPPTPSTESNDSEPPSPAAR